MSEQRPSTLELRQEIFALGPWHLEVEITPDISTRVWLEAPPEAHHADIGSVSFINPRQTFRRLMGRIYPGGLSGKVILDSACNCGGYSFWAKELGAARCFGFDVREHWVRQARFLAEHRDQSSDGIVFEVCDLYDLPRLDVGRFDVALFNGLFYHLPDPVTGLKVVADRTDELLIVNTATRSGWPDGALVASEESRTGAMSGVYGLNWFPTGPGTICRILRWLGFVETCCTFWHKEATNQPPGQGRLEVVGSRTQGLLENLSLLMERPAAEQDNRNAR